MKEGWRYIRKVIDNKAYECWFKDQQRIERHGYRIQNVICWVTTYHSYNGSEFIDCTDRLESAMDSLEAQVPEAHSASDC